MSTRKIVGFNDEIEFLVVNDQIQVIDNGSLYKNKLRNGLLLDTLCSMDVQYEDVIYENEVDKVEEKRCIKINYDTEEINDEIIKSNGRQRNKNKKNKMTNEREKRRRNKSKMRKNGNDYKMNNYYDENHKVVKKAIIPTNHFGKKEIDKYAPLCNDCFTYTMITKRYYMLYKCSYDTKCCHHLNCWLCKYNDGGVYNAVEFCCVGCYDNYSSIEKCYHMKRNDGYVKLKCSLHCRECSRSCHCGEEYGDDYGKKYKCGQSFEFNFDTHINYENYLDKNGNIIVEIKDDINVEPINREKIYLNNNNKYYDYYSDYDYYDYYSDDYDADMDLLLD